MAIVPRLAALWRDHPSRWALALLFVLMLMPQFDLPLARVFYLPETNFHWNLDPTLDWVRAEIPDIIVGSFAVCVVVWIATVLKPEWPRWFTTRRIAYLLLTLLLGPGLIVETLLKPLWGRARPKDLVPFGGDAAYTLPWQWAHECATNCSFVSGHAAIAFWVTAYAFLLPPRFRPAAIVFGVALGFAVGFVRIAQGGHFLSDIVAAGFIVVLINDLLAQAILKPSATA